MAPDCSTPGQCRKSNKAGLVPSAIGYELGNGGFKPFRDFVLAPGRLCLILRLLPDLGSEVIISTCREMGRTTPPPDPSRAGRGRGPSHRDRHVLALANTPPHTATRARTQTHSCAHVCRHACAYTNKYTSTHTARHAHTHAHIHTHIYTCPRD